MGLARSAVLSGVEKREKPLRPLGRMFLFPCLQTRVGCLKVLLLQQMGLRLVRLGCQYEVVRDHRVFVENEEVGCIGGRYVCYPEIGGGVVERVFLFTGSVVFLRGRLLGERWAVPELELRKDQ